MPNEDNIERINIAKSVTICSEERTGFIPQLRRGDALWDILLHTYIAQSEEIDLSGKIISDKIQTSDSLTKRYIDLLSERGLLVCDGPVFEMQTTPVQLSDTGIKALEGWLDFCIEIQRK